MLLWFVCTKRNYSNEVDIDVPVILQHVLL